VGGLLAIKRKKEVSEYLGRRDILSIDTETNVKKNMRQDYFEIKNLR